jgi:multiple sugar transport system permease protein
MTSSPGTRAGWGVHAGLLLGGALMLAPFAWLLLNSVKTNAEILAVPPQWLPTTLRWENFSNAWEALPFARAYFNSLYITALIVGGQLVTCSMAAYAFAKLRFPLRGPLFVLFLAALMVPPQVLATPLYLVMRELGWLNSHLSLIVPNGLVNAFGVFLLRQYMLGIPHELSDAARIDGASHWTIYRRIVLPLCKAPLAALALMTFLYHYNNFFLPLIFLDDPSQYTVPLLVNSFRGQYTTDYGLVLAATTTAIVPVLLVYAFTQRRVIDGVQVAGARR